MSTNTVERSGSKSNLNKCRGVVIIAFSAITVMRAIRGKTHSAYLFILYYIKW